MIDKKFIQYGVGILALIVLAGFYIKVENGVLNPSEEKRLIPETKILHGHGLAVDVQDSSTIYIATHHGLLVLKNDAELYRVGESHDDYMGFLAHPSNPAIFYTSGHPMRGGNLGFQKSEDKGFMWQKIADGVNGPVDFHAMAISSTNPNLFYGWYRGDIQKSEDEGKTWEIVNRDLLVVQITADPVDENTVYAATPDGRGILVSRDKGLTWKSVSEKLEGGKTAVIAVHPQNNQEMLAFAEKIGGLGKSTDGGKTWNNLNDKFENDTVLFISYDKNNPDTVYLLTHTNALYKSTNGGNLWKKIF